MKCNVGNSDKIIRYVLGAVIIAAGLYLGSWWGALGAVLIVTASISWCPLYRLFRLDTCETEKAA